MATFGLLGIRSAFLLRRGHAEARRTPLVIGGMYVLFGFAALAATSMRPHFLFFVVMGLPLLFGGALWSDSGEQNDRSARATLG